MTTILDARRTTELTRAIAGDETGNGAGFTDADDFAIFVSDQLNDNFEPLKGEPFNVQVLNYVKRRNTNGGVGDLLDSLSVRWSKRGDLLPVVKDLIDFLNVGDAVRSWFLSTVSLEEERFNDLDRKGAFESFKDMLRRPASLYGRLSDIREDMNRSSFFVALIGQYYKKSKIACEIFDTAFKGWKNRISGDPSLRQRLIVMYLDDEGRLWWETKYEKEIPPEGDALVKVLDANLATLKAELRDWLSKEHEPAEPSGDGGNREPAPAIVVKNVLVLGQPAGPAGTVSATIDNMVSYLRNRAPNLVEHWKDGWAEKVLTPNERSEIRNKNPLFIRAICDRYATIREAQVELMGYLMTALGYSPSQWTSEFGKLSQIYWRPDGPEWAENNGGLGWIGQPLDFGTRLAEFAGFPNKPDRKAIVRYEDPRSDDEMRTGFNRNLVRTALESAATQNSAGVPILPNTVPISFDRIEDSIKKFTKNGLNVIALHDLEARPLDVEDTVRRFEGADKRIDNAVNSLFGNVERSPILRVAILLKNAAAFDGLTFDQSTSVRRWNLLKCPSDASGQPAYDSEDYRHIESEARAILANVE